MCVAYGADERTEQSAPIFFKRFDGTIALLPRELAELQVAEGSKLVYLGKAVALAETVAE